VTPTATVRGDRRFRYLAVGAYSAAVYYALCTALCTALINYQLSKLWAFRH
jgi:putative flippase GtrA